MSSGRFSPRVQSIPSVRRLIYDANFDYYEDGGGRPETRTGQAGYGMEFDNNDTLDLRYTNYYERLTVPFAIAPGIRLPVSVARGRAFDRAHHDQVRRPRGLRHGARRIVERLTPLSHGLAGDQLAELVMHILEAGLNVVAHLHPCLGG